MVHELMAAWRWLYRNDPEFKAWVDAELADARD